MNQQRKMHHHEIARHVLVWRHYARDMAEEEGLIDGPVDVYVSLYLRGRRSQDVGACYPAVKAAIDGLVDAGVLIDDTPEYVRSIKMHAPVLNAPRDTMRIRLYPA